MENGVGVNVHHLDSDGKRVSISHESIEIEINVRQLHLTSVRMINRSRPKASEASKTKADASYPLVRVSD